VPVIVDDDGTAVTDSTAIARHLDERYPERSIHPTDAALRARALLLEEWADEGLPRVVQPVRWLLPGNARREAARFRSAYPPGRVDDAAFALVARVVKHDIRAKYKLARSTDYLNRLAEAMRYLDGALAETGWLAGPAPSVADFAVYGFVAQLEGLDGWETVKAHRRVVKLVKQLAPDGARAAPEAYDAADEALLDASRLRRNGRE
jgi:glutathione S-transferase